MSLAMDPVQPPIADPAEFLRQARACPGPLEAWPPLRRVDAGPGDAGGGFRWQVVQALYPACQLQDRPLVRYLLRQAMAAAESEGAGLAWDLKACAILLYRMGQAEDAALLWRAKNIHYDTFAGLDVQYLAGAGLDATLQFLDSLACEPDLPVLAQETAEGSRAFTVQAYLRACRDAGDFDADILACVAGGILDFEADAFGSPAP